MSVAVEKRDYTWLHLGISLILTFGIGALKPIGEITEIGMNVLGVFIGLIYGLSTIGMIWPSLIAFVCLPFTGIITTKDLIIGGWGTDTVLFMIIVLMFTKLIEITGVSRYLASWFITKRFLNGRPWLFTFFLLMAAVMVASFVNIFLAIFLVWGMFYDICKKVDFKPHEKYPTLMVIGIVLMALIGSASMPYKDNPLILLNSFTMMSGVEIDLLNYALFSLPACLLSIMVYMGICKYIFRADVSALKNFNVDMIDNSDNKLDTTKKIILGFLLAFLCLMFLPSVLPQSWLIVEILKTLGNTGTILLLFIVMWLVKVNGKRLIDFQQLASQGIIWDVVVLTMAIMPLGMLLTTDATGIKPFLMTHLTQIFQGLSPMVFIVTLVFFVVLLTNFFNNMVVALVFIPIALSFADQIGGSVIPVVYMIVVFCHCAILTPAACPFAALLFANTEWVRPKEVYMYAPIILLILVGTLVAYGYLWGLLFY